jgi:hypothetical protein
MFNDARRSSMVVSDPFRELGISAREVSVTCGSAPAGSTAIKRSRPGLSGAARQGRRSERSTDPPAKRPPC